MSQKILLLGGSRGLGRKFLETVLENDNNGSHQILLISRKATQLDIESLGNIKCIDFDFSKTEQQKLVISEALDFQPNRVFYFASGGPYGSFSQKQWKDHQWALEVSLLCPLRVFHALSQGVFLKQFVFIGSSVAEDAGDKAAASYAVAKHGLLGFYRSVQLESPSIDIRLFSPGYMDTDMLPAHSKPRELGLCLDPKEVAIKLYDWSNKEAEFGGYLR
ncbi:MAG: SDR family NAD(P)-dependent oxidoreductase [Bdellovibrionaceae bacterium]|jgi:short-subunit dehydrogenase|nr:SDR family NAD(P)-dependent oxidoreductase [Pseudobdellovibrionaceae bacterium]